jgi:hypothetical protein
MLNLTVHLVTTGLLKLTEPIYTIFIMLGLQKVFFKPKVVPYNEKGCEPLWCGVECVDDSEQLTGKKWLWPNLGYHPGTCVA